MDYGQEDETTATRMAALDAWLSEATPKELRFAEVKLRNAKDAMRTSLKNDLTDLDHEEAKEKPTVEDRTPTGRKRRKDYQQPKPKRIHLLNTGTANQTAEE